MERLVLRQRAVLKTPDIEGRFTKKGSFKETIKVLRMIGEPNASTQEDPHRHYVTSPKRKPGAVFYPHTKSSRSERREAARRAEKAHSTTLRAIQVANERVELGRVTESSGSDAGGNHGDALRSGTEES
jgi:hypothetical protein